MKMREVVLLVVHPVHHHSDTVENAKCGHKVYLIISRGVNGNNALPAPAAVHVCSCPSQYLHGYNLFGVKTTCNPVKTSPSWIAIYHKQRLFSAILLQ